MEKALGQLLPLAIGVALSPVPIIAVILMLFSARASSNGPAFLVGWIIGSLSVAIAVLYYLLGGEGARRTLDAWKTWLQQNNAAVMAVLLLVLGAVLVGQSTQTLAD